MTGGSNCLHLEIVSLIFIYKECVLKGDFYIFVFVGIAKGAHDVFKI